MLHFVCPSFGGGGGVGVGGSTLVTSPRSFPGGGAGR